MTRRRLVAGNWKMNGDAASARSLVAGIVAGMDATGDTEVAVFPPSPYLGLVREMARGSELAWGAQNISEHAAGAYTGEIAAAMLLDFGCRYTLVGHSERRNLFGETDQAVAAKMARALEAGVTPVLCVGETLDEREAGRTEAVVGAQLSAAAERVGIKGLERSILAYEPVWAIGTGKTASPEQAQAVHAFLRTQVAAMDDTIASRLRILYGGSVKGSNAAELFAMADIDGGLIGGASLTHEEFLNICRA